MRIEILQIVYTLAYADLENRKLEFVRNRQSDTALSRTIKFRYDDPSKSSASLNF